MATSVTVLRSADYSRCLTPNCGRWAMIDGYIGELIAEIGALGIADNTVVMWPRPGVNPAMAGIFNLYWDPREDHPLKDQGVWAGTPFVRMRAQHLRMKD